MKKLLFVAVALVAITFSACKGNGTNSGVAADTTAVDTVVVDTVDTVVVDTVVVD